MNNNSIAIQKSEIGRSVACLDKSRYLQAMSTILNSNTNFELLQLDNEKELNYVFNLEKKIMNVLKYLKNKKEISGVNYNHLHPSFSCPSILYGLTKVHKPVMDPCPSL